MPARLRKISPLLAAIALLTLGLFALLRFRSDPAPEPDSDDHLADLGADPDWSKLARYDGVLTRAEFETALREVYLFGGAPSHCTITDESVSIEARGLPGGQVVRFAGAESQVAPPRFWRPADQLPPAPADLPLRGLRIAIDPGHIGGSYAKLEERWYQVRDTKPVAEGDLTLDTARLLHPRLEALGAEVTLLRDGAKPVTNSEPKDFADLAVRKRPGHSREDQERYAVSLFYRTADIRARA
jgi:N-acetylmuramoyl-L-alanine amidase